MGFPHPLSSLGGLRPLVGVQSREAEAWLLEVSDLPQEEVYRRFHTSPQGLSPEEAQRRLAVYGPNEVPERPELSLLRRLVGAFASPFNAILLFVVAVSALTDIVLAPPESRNPAGVLIVLALILLSGLLRFLQDWRSDEAAKKLKRLVALHTTVVRGGQVLEGVPVRELVPGDFVRLSAGDMVPADLRVLSAKDLFVNQSALTGEAEPVEKLPLPAPPGEAPSPNPLERPNLAFMGSSVVSGSGLGVVVATGPRTYFGHLAHSLAQRRQATGFELGVNQVSWLFIRFMLAMVPLVFLFNLSTGKGLLEALLFALSVAVGLTPEMLPMIVTVSLARGALDMSRKKVIVKRLSAMQNFGAMDILCTDKTGTLTQDRIALEFYLNIRGREDPRVLRYAFLNSFFQTGLQNVLDRAILAYVGQGLEELKSLYRKVDEIPFDFVRKRLSVVLEGPDGQRELITKGAAEEVLGISAYAEDQGQVIPLTEALRREILERIHRLNAKGLRVLAVARKPEPPSPGAFTPADEREMILVGYLAFLDPPKESAPRAIASLKAHGVELKILTGDSERVAQALAQKVGLEVKGVLLGSDLEGLDEEALRRAVEENTVFAKLAPAHKTRIVQALRQNGHTVGFLGDGINDAPAMHAADVGISVENAVDIAKEAADIILLERDLGILGEGILEGRTVFGNIRKYIKITASSNFGNTLSVLAASLFLPFLPMRPLQILFLNLTYNLAMTTLPWDRMDPEALRRPRPWDAPLIGRYMLWYGPLSSLFDLFTFAFLFLAIGPLTLGGAYALLPPGLKEGFATLFQTGWFVESLWTQTLVVHMLRTEKIPFLESRPAAPLFWASFLAVGFGTLVPYLPLGRALGMVPLPWAYFLGLGAFLLAYLLLAQLVKGRFVRRYGYLV